ncbi:hypothetical protein G9A89_004281 [Geosiphon pyriformis]|nr:hypothetical protein G9A89_004281 [Geosiphon pyriformis]
MPITCPVSFGGKTWAQVADESLSHVVFLVVFGAKSYPNVKILLMGSDFLMVTGLNDCLAFLEHSLELLAEQVSGILKKLSSIELVPLPLVSLASPPVISASLNLSANSNMMLDAPQVFSFPPITVINNAASDFGFSSSKILTTKVGGLESKIIALDAVVDTVLARLDLLCSGLETKLKGRICSWIVNKFDGVRMFTSGLDSGYLGVGVVIVVNFSLVRHVCKISEVPGWLLSIKLLFKNKLLVSILGLYAGTSLVVQGDFNENSLCKSASFRKCLDLELVNSLLGSPVTKSPTWGNLRGVEKTINYVFVSPSLISAIVYCEVLEVGKYYDMDHQAVSVSIDLGGLLDAQLNSLRKQANKDH